MNGWFGNVMGGGGHDIQTVGLGQPARWQGAAMVGNFTDKRQISLILNGNNTNNRGFNDMAGSMMTAMRGGSGGMGRGGGMWGNNSGILTSWMGGLNGVWTLLDGRMDLGGNYLYNGSKKEIEESSSKITYKDDGRDLISDSDGWSNTLAQGHRFGIRLEHKFSDKTSILFEPQFNFGSGSFDYKWRQQQLADQRLPALPSEDRRKGRQDLFREYALQLQRQQDYRFQPVDDRRAFR